MSIDHIAEVKKYNDNHDPATGRFAPKGGGGGAAAISGKKKLQDEVNQIVSTGFNSKGRRGWSASAFAHENGITIDEAKEMYINATKQGKNTTNKPGSTRASGASGSKTGGKNADYFDAPKDGDCVKVSGYNTFWRRNGTWISRGFDEQMYDARMKSFADANAREGKRVEVGKPTGDPYSRALVIYEPAQKSLDTITEVNKSVDEIEHIEKFNPFHDARGRFSSSKGMASYSANPKTKAGAMAINRSTAAGYGAVMNVHRESKGENIRQNDNWIRSGQKPNASQLARAQANAPKTLAQARQNAHTNRVKGTMGATETATARHPKPTKPTVKQPQNQQAANQQNQQNQQAQQAQANQNQKMAHVKQKMNSGVTMDADFDQSTVAGAKNKEFRGTAEGKDLTKSFDARGMKATDDHWGSDRFTDKVADLQGFNSPAKMVPTTDFNKLEAQFGDVFFRTVDHATINGRRVDAQGMKDAYTTENDLKMNGSGGRAHGDGIYVASAGMCAHSKGKSKHTLADVNSALADSQCYGDGKTTLRMTWNSKPNIVNKSTLEREWNNLSQSDRDKFGNHINTYACAKGYDAMRSRHKLYMVVFNRSKLAVDAGF